MDVKKIILVAILSCLAFFTQANEKEAFQAFKQARSAYNSQDYQQASRLLLKTKSLLGSTNIRIQPMLIKSLVNVKSWKQAQIEVANYYALDPDKSLIEYREIVSLEPVINKELAAAERRRKEEQARKESARLASIKKAKQDLKLANQGQVYAMDRMVKRYRSGDGVAVSISEAQKWENRAEAKRKEIAAQEEAERRAREKKYIAQRIENTSYFPGTKRFAKSIQRDFNRDPGFSTTMFPFSPIATVFAFASDLAASKPSDATAEIQRLKSKAVSRPASWGNPDSLMAKAYGETK